MTPMFSPPTPFGNPPIFLAGVGPRMVEMVGEVADGFFVHPFHSRSFLDAETLPALERGRERAGRTRKDLTISCQTIVALGSKDAEIAAARQKARGQISFYGSTPAYKGVLEHHGYPELQPELNRLSKQGKWLDMLGRIDDALFDQLAVSGTPAEVAAKLRARNAFADRSTLMFYNETHPEAVVDVVRELGARSEPPEASPRVRRTESRVGAALSARALSVARPTGRRSRGRIVAMGRYVIGAFTLALALGLGCREEGVAEKAGRKLDEAVEKLQHPDEGALEKLGRKTDEALDDAKAAVEDATERD
jgi:hypothetical protein